MGLNQAATGGRLAGTELVVVIGGGGGFTDRWWQRLYTAEACKIWVWIKPEPNPKSVGSGSGFVFQIQTGSDRVRVW